MHMRHCLASLQYEHGVMDHIESDEQGGLILEVCRKLKVHMRKSKTRKKSKKDTEKGLRRSLRSLVTMTNCNGALSCFSEDCIARKK